MLGSWRFHNKTHGETNHWFTREAVLNWTGLWLGMTIPEFGWRPWSLCQINAFEQGVDLKLPFEYGAAQFAQRRPKRGPQKVVKYCKGWATEIKTDRTKSDIIDSDGSETHNHDSLSSRAIERVLISIACKRKAIDNVDVAPRKILCREMKAAREMNAAVMHSVRTV